MRKRKYVSLERTHLNWSDVASVEDSSLYQNKGERKNDLCGDHSETSRINKKKRVLLDNDESDDDVALLPTMAAFVEENDCVGNLACAPGTSSKKTRKQKRNHTASTNASKVEQGDKSKAMASEPASSWPPVPQCHNIVSTSQILSSQKHINLQRLADLFPFTTYDRKRFAAITIRLANPHCTCLLFGSGKLVITGSTSFNACMVASHEITRLLRRSSPRDWFEVNTCIIQNIVAHVELPPGISMNLDQLYSVFCECSTYQRSIFPGLVLRPPNSPIVLLIFTSGRIVCTGGRSYDDIYFGFNAVFETLKKYIIVHK